MTKPLLSRLWLAVILLSLALTPRPAMAEVSARLQAVLPRFEALVRQGMKDWETPGVAVAIVNNGSVWTKGYGVTRYGGSEAVNPDTLFQIASITKSFTAVLVGMEADRGALTFNDRVVDHLPQFMTYDSWVTREFRVRDLLAQRSGLPTCGGDLQAMFGNSRPQIEFNIRHIKPVTSFRSQYAYQNSLFLVAGSLVERLSHQPFDQDVRRRIFTPLGMRRSTATVKAFLEAPNTAFLHQRQDGAIKALPKDWPYQFAAQSFGPAAVIASSAKEMAAYVSLHMKLGEYHGRSLVEPETMRRLHSPVTPVGHPGPGCFSAYCQGLMVDFYRGLELVWHNGGSPGHHAMMMFDAKGELGVVILSNLQGNMLPECLAWSLFDLYHGFPEVDRSSKLAAKFRATPLTAVAPAPVAQAIPARPLRAYTGTFTNQVAGPIRIALEKGKLVASLGNMPGRYPLRHYNADTFWLSLPMVDEDASGFARFQFTPRGEAEVLNLEALAENGIGPFRIKAKGQ